MRMRRLGTVGPEITTVGYGAWQAGGAAWGPRRSDDEVMASMHAALDAGMNWIDTAEVYGDGVSEQLVGRAIAGRRDQVLVFTKVAPDDEGSGVRPDDIRRAVRGSLQRLGIDHIDLYQVHWRDDAVPVEETWGTMAELVDEGLVRFIGVSNFDRPLIERCTSIHPVTSVQNELSLLHREDVDGLLPWLDEQGIGYLAYSPLASGLLTGTLGPESSFADNDWRRDEFTPEQLERGAAAVRALEEPAGRLGVATPTLALAWVIAQRGVTAAIAGTLSAHNARTNASASDVEPDARTLAELSAA